MSYVTKAANRTDLVRAQEHSALTLAAAGHCIEVRL